MGGKPGGHLRRRRIDGDRVATLGRRDRTARDRWQWDNTVRAASTETRLVDGKANYTKGNQLLDQDYCKGVGLALFWVRY